jgi:hypothetical protein
MLKAANFQKDTTQEATSLSRFVAATIGVHFSVRTRRTTTLLSKLNAVANSQPTQIRKRGLTHSVRAASKADPASSGSLACKTMGAIVDLIQAQGMAAGQIYGYVPDPPWGPPHRCPGCQPRPDKPQLAAKWDEWHACEKKLLALGETSSCPIVRGEKMPDPYTDSERIARGGMPMQRMPLSSSAQPQAPKTSSPGIVLAVAVGAEQARQESTVKPGKVPTKRAAKAPQVPKGQGSLF